jgi:membrane protease YdiL (CAAX protease family)
MAWRGDVVTPGGSVTHFPGLAGPLVAALLVTAIAGGRVGLGDYAARLARWRVAPRWYAAAALPYLIFLGTIGAMVVVGAETPPLNEWSAFSGLPVMELPFVVLLVLLFNGFGEEGGWRGFLTPALLKRRGPFATSMVVALIWFTWHVPSFLVIETYRNLGVGIVPMMGIGLISGATVLTWLYVGSGASIWIVALWHLALNFGSATLAGRELPGMILWIAIVLWAMAIWVSWLIAAEPASRPLMKRLRDGWMINMLHSPMGGYMPGMTVIGFRGRVSGRTFMTPVECVRDGNRLIVFVADAETKQWWRNVQADPNVTVEVMGRDVKAVATVNCTDCPDAEHDLEVYIEHRPRVARLLGLTTRPIDRRALAAAAARTVSVRLDLGPQTA